MPSEPNSSAAPPQVHAKYAHAALPQLRRAALHVARQPAATEPVHEQRNAMGLDRPIIMQHNAIAVGQRHSTLP
jgi:hypothetical protein